MVSDANKVVATYIANLENLLRSIKSMNEDGILKIPNEITGRYSDTISTLQQLDLNQIKNLYRAKELMLNLNTGETFLKSHTQYQAAKQNFELPWSVLAGSPKQQFNQ